jgi:hypothetical protein
MLNQSRPDLKIPKESRFLELGISRAGSRSLPTGWLKINPTNGERESRLPAVTKIFIKGRNPPLFAKQVFDVARLDDAKRWCLRREYCGYKNKFRIPCCFYQRGEQ